MSRSRPVGMWRRRPITGPMAAPIFVPEVTGIHHLAHPMRVKKVKERRPSGHSRPGAMSTSPRSGLSYAPPIRQARNLRESDAEALEHERAASVWITFRQHLLVEDVDLPCGSVHPHNLDPVRAHLADRHIGATGLQLDYIAYNELFVSHSWSLPPVRAPDHRIQAPEYVPDALMLALRRRAACLRSLPAGNAVRRALGESLSCRPSRASASTTSFTRSTRRVSATLSATINIRAYDHSANRHPTQTENGPRETMGAVHGSTCTRPRAKQ
jgi:hypothetical protein